MRPAHGLSAVRRHTLLLVAGFALTRLLYAAAGVRFDIAPLDRYWQYADTELLRHDLFTTLWNFHIQPPLFNLIVGIGLRMGGSHFAGVMQGVFMAAGLCLLLSLHRLMVRLGVPSGWSAIISLAFIASPPAILFENWLYVDYLVAAGLAAAALFVHRFATDRRTIDAFAAFSLLAAISLSRTLFHLLWLVLVVIAIAWACRAWRQVLTAAAVPLLLVAGLYTKNYVKFGTFGPTSCVGLSVARVTTYQLDHDDIERLIASGKLSPLAATSAFLLPAVYPDLFAHEKPTGVAALDRVMKSNRTTNVNNVAYLGICRQYTSDGMVALREHPGRFVNAVAVGNLVFLRPSSDYLLFSAQNKSAVRPVERPFSVALGQFARDDALVPGLSDGVTTVAWFVLAAYLAAVIVGVRRVRRRRGDPPAAPELAVTVFVLVCIAYVATVGNLLESGENNRFRFVLDGLVVCLLASEWWKRRRSRATEAHGTQRVESSVSSTR